jgi:heme oxygenase
MTNQAQMRLRDATQADHRRLEIRTDILARIARPDERRVLVEGFRVLHAEAEAALAPWLADLPGLDFEARRRSDRLARDLAALGGRPGSAAAERPIVANVAEALGRMYVLEGSTLGGQVIRRAVEARGDGMLGLSFLDPYGARTGERWRAFLAVLDAHAATPADTDAMIAGARDGFRHAEHRLCGAMADV